MTWGKDGDVVRLVRTAEGAAREDQVLADLCTCLDYLEDKARAAGFQEMATLIGIAALAGRTDGR
jgi:hypothetical protein